MKTLLKTDTSMHDVLVGDREVKSYIYQQIVEFQPYITPTTIVEVIAKDPVRLKDKLEAMNADISLSDLRKMYRIAIIVKEDNSRIVAEAVDYNIFDAIRRAKEILLTKLHEIQDRIISNQERLTEINHYLQNPSKH